MSVLSEEHYEELKHEEALNWCDLEPCKTCGYPVNLGFQCRNCGDDNPRG